MSMRINIAGQRFSYLVAESWDGQRGQRNAPYWICRCDCGAVKSILQASLRSGKTRACGRCEFTTLMTIDAKGSHGEGRSRHRTPEHVAHQAMMQRCYDKNGAAYKNYGGRGISVCERWRESYVNFLADMGRKPTPAHTLDRINNDGNYEPGNCRWATRLEQAANKRPPQKRRAA